MRAHPRSLRKLVGQVQATVGDCVVWCPASECEAACLQFIDLRDSCAIEISKLIDHRADLVGWRDIGLAAKRHRSTDLRPDRNPRNDHGRARQFRAIGGPRPGYWKTAQASALAAVAGPRGRKLNAPGLCRLDRARSCGLPHQAEHQKSHEKQVASPIRHGGPLCRMWRIIARYGERRLYAGLR